MKTCFECVPKEGCPNDDRVINPCLAEDCDDYYDIKFHCEVMLDDDPLKSERIERIVGYHKASRGFPNET